MLLLPRLPVDAARMVLRTPEVLSPDARATVVAQQVLLDYERSTPLRTLVSRRKVKHEVDRPPQSRDTKWNRSVSHITALFTSSKNFIKYSRFSVEFYGIYMTH